MRKMCWMETAKRIRSGGASSTSYRRLEGRLRVLSSASSEAPGATHVDKRWRTEDKNEFARPSVAIESILSRHVRRDGSGRCTRESAQGATVYATNCCCTVKKWAGDRFDFVSKPRCRTARGKSPRRAARLNFHLPRQRKRLSGKQSLAGRPFAAGSSSQAKPLDCAQRLAESLDTASVHTAGMARSRYRRRSRGHRAGQNR